ncbi:hypothetical protein Y1Q_0010665 [Alligator mississippiensis]|uniref:Uncharacterized protein n=1 Tax=Alligator mississippiensis TaxID=8496 RepID=A0A151M6F4_ALLMI|nr:hypothetical protein Y1Q_0010665 [Alligator mississippiensis]
METLETLLQCALCLWLERREELPTPFTNAKEAATASGLWLPTSVPSGVSFIGLTRKLAFYFQDNIYVI